MTDICIWNHTCVYAVFGMHQTYFQIYLFELLKQGSIREKSNIAISGTSMAGKGSLDVSAFFSMFLISHGDTHTTVMQMIAHYNLPIYNLLHVLTTS